MSSRATNIIEKLKNGETVSFRPHGNSMTPKIESGQLVTLEPVKDYKALEKGDIVYCKVKGNVYLHLISAIKNDGEEFQISNNHGHVNGWTASKNVFGKLTKVEK